MKGATLAIAAALCVALPGGLLALPATSTSRTSAEPTGFTSISEVSHTGRWVLGADTGLRLRIVDLQTNSTIPAWSAPVEGGLDYGTLRAMVRDNPSLILETQPVVPVVDSAGATIGHGSGPVWLTDTVSGTRARIDTDSAGNPLEPAWTGLPEWEDPQENAYPHVIVGAESVTRSGAVVAFCANYEARKEFTLYIKDLRTGALAKRAEACGAGGPEPGGEYVWVSPPEISYNGRVVHLRGAIYSDGVADPDAAFYPGTLVFPNSGKAARTIRGNGSMTRNGKLVFMRKGVREVGQPDRTKGRVGVYKISTKRTKRLPGRYTIYGTNAFVFSAFDRATWRGRYVVYGNRAAVIDRKKGSVYKVGKVMRRHGFPPDRDPGLLISGNGTWVFALSGGEYVAVDWK